MNDDDRSETGNSTIDILLSRVVVDVSERVIKQLQPLIDQAIARINTAQIAVKPAEAARLLDITPKTIYNYMDAGILPYSKIGTSRRILTADIIALVLQYQVKQSEEASSHE